MNAIFALYAARSGCRTADAVSSIGARNVTGALTLSGSGSMCLAVPMQIDEIDGLEGRCSAKGVSRAVSFFLLRDRELKAGDWVLVHVGYAIQVVPEAQAGETWALFDQALVED